jgi:hypothetical protein
MNQCTVISLLCGRSGGKKHELSKRLELLLRTEPHQVSLAPSRVTLENRESAREIGRARKRERDREGANDTERERERNPVTISRLSD